MWIGTEQSSTMLLVDFVLGCYLEAGTGTEMGAAGIAGRAGYPVRVCYKCAREHMTRGSDNPPHALRPSHHPRIPEEPMS